MDEHTAKIEGLQMVMNQNTLSNPPLSWSTLEIFGGRRCRKLELQPYSRVQLQHHQPHDPGVKMAGITESTGPECSTTSNAALGGYKMQQRSNVMDVAAFKDNQLASPDGTPPSNGLAEEAFRSATPSYYRRGTQQGWLGTEYRPDVGPAKPLGLPPEVNGTGSGTTTEGSDIIGLMEAVWCAPGLSDLMCILHQKLFNGVHLERVVSSTLGRR